MSSRNYALDLIRGLAAIGVAAYHYASWTFGFTVQSLGTFGVYIFFVLSGLTMMMVYGETFSKGVTLSDAKGFYLNRIARLLPLLAAVAFASLLVRLIIHDAPVGISLGQSFMTGTALFSLHLPGMLSNTVGAWSLGIEALFYMMFPMVALAAMNARLRTFAVAAATLLAAQHILLFLLADIQDYREFWNYYTTALTFAPFFALGCLIHKFGHRPNRAYLGWSLTLFAIVGGYSLFFEGDVLRNHWPYLFLTLLAALIVFTAYNSTVPAWLKSTSEFVGNISYALYLTHWMANFWVEALLAPYAPPWATAVAFGAASVLLAYSSFVLFERPSRNFIRKRAAAPTYYPQQATLP